ncbi:MAG: type II toxin-antitoxin system VapC family toxin [Acidimicrobiales bacterium]
MNGEPVLGLADTSLFIALEQARIINGTPPERIAVSVVTVAELSLGVLAARTGEQRGQRLKTLRRAEALDPLPIGPEVAHSWARLRLSLRDSGRRMPINDSWIAATALDAGIPVVAQDSDYDDVPGLSVIRL